MFCRDWSIVHVMKVQTLKLPMCFMLIHTYCMVNDVSVMTSIIQNKRSNLLVNSYQWYLVFCPANSQTVKLNLI